MLALFSSFLVAMIVAGGPSAGIGIHCPPPGFTLTRASGLPGSMPASLPAPAVGPVHAHAWWAVGAQCELVPEHAGVQPRTEHSRGWQVHAPAGRGRHGPLPVIAAPEPSLLVLVATGLAAAWNTARHERRRSLNRNRDTAPAVEGE